MLLTIYAIPSLYYLLYTLHESINVDALIPERWEAVNGVEVVIIHLLIAEEAVLFMGVFADDFEF